MRALAITLVLVAAGCGGKRQAGPAGPGAAVQFPAARFIPGKPTYVFAAKSMRDAQRAFGDAIDTLGMMAGVGRAEVSAGLTSILQVDPLSPEAMASIGVDLDGSMALFSGEIDPTLVVHLSSPQALQDFIAKQRQRGMASQSVMIEGAEVFTAKVDSELTISWAIDADWLFVHLAFAPHGDTSDWFGASRHPGTPTWGASWDAAQKLATKGSGLTGILDLRAFTAKLASHIPELVPCARQFEPVNGIGIAVEADGNWVGAKLDVDVGGAAPAIAGHLIAPPPGWDVAATKAPIAAQWNLDLRSAAGWIQPCMAGGPNLTALLDEFGVRGARAFVHTLDPDDKSGTGVIAFDLTHPRFFEAQLGQIPMRSKFERSRQFGAYKGKHLSVPFVATADYVLDDRVFIAAMGDGQLERAATGAASGQPAVLAIDVIPAGLSQDVWAWLFSEAELPNPKRLAQRLQSWNNIHLGAQIDREHLVIDAQGNRR